MLERENIPEAQQYVYFHKQIKVVGCGGAGLNVINYINSMGIFGADTIAIDTDQDHISVIRADKKFMLDGQLKGQRTVESVKKAAEAIGYKVHETFQNTKLVIIISGLGGVTGSGSAPAIAKHASDYGALIISIVTMPFKDEREKWVIAEKAMEELLNFSDIVIPVHFDRLPGYDPGIPRENAYFMMDELLSEKIMALVECITKRTLSHITVFDLKRILKKSGKAVMFLREFTKDKDLLDNLSTSFEFPMSDDDHGEATRALIHITTTKDIPFEEAKKIYERISSLLPENVQNIWGAQVKKDFDNKIKLMIILSGFK
jgi:cell division protein FtsZ